MTLLLLLRSPAGAPPPTVVTEVPLELGTPDLLVEIDYADPTGAFVGTDETFYVRSWSFSRGRSTGLDQQQAGRATVVLDDRTGRFDPANRSSALWPNVTVYRRLRISAILPAGSSAFTMRLSANRDGDAQRAGTMTLPLFTGFITNWDQDWNPAVNEATTTVSATDGFLILKQSEFNYGFIYNSFTNDFSCNQTSGNVVPTNGPPFIPDDLAGARINNVLDCVDWPTTERDVDPGTVTILGSTDYAGGTQNIQVSSNALTYIQQVAESEGGGWLFMDPSGKVRFVDWAHLPTVDPYDVFGEEDTEQPYQDIDAPFDDAQLFNRITVTTTHSNITGQAEVADPASRSRFNVELPRSVTLVPVESSVMYNRAADFLLRYRYPRLRLPTLGLRPKTIGGWRRVLGHELADMVRVVRRPGGADEIERDSRIEGISISSANYADWKVDWQLSSTPENLLAWEQTSPEGSGLPVFPGRPIPPGVPVTGWAAEFNCTISAGGTGLFGDALVLTATAAGDSSARTTPDGWVPVEPGRWYEATAYFKTVATSRSCAVHIVWQDAGGSAVTTSQGSIVTDTDWAFATVAAPAPASVSFAVVRVIVAGPVAVGEQHQVDFVTLSRI